MNVEWAKKRKIIYGLLVASIGILFFIYFFRSTLFPVATCFDTKQNGYETGIDCGGTCSLRCTQDVIPLSVVWARALKTASSTYDFVGFISNKNIDNAPQQIAYTFVAYNAEGKEIKQVQGSTIVPIDGDFPIIEQNVQVAENPVEIQVTIGSNVPHYTVLEKPQTPTIRISGTRYEAGSIPRVYATITNTKRIVLRNLLVRALMYDADGNVFAAGKTVIPLLDKEGVKEIVFTWDKAFSLDPTKIRIFPILDPFLGSL